MSVPTAGVSSLPIRLRNFFARYPPQIYSALAAPQPIPPPESTEAAAEKSLPSPYTPNRDAKGATKPDPEELSFSRSLLHNDPKSPNPFLPQKIFRTGKWKGPRYGLRQQADLVKLAIKYNVEPLLPPGPKSTPFKAARLAERGLAIKGTGIGQKVKGHKWERTMEARLEDRRKAMLEMPEMIRLWKQVSFLQNPFLSKAVTNCAFNREAMVVVGASGPSGKYEHSFSSVPIVIPLSATLTCYPTEVFFLRKGFRLWGNSRLLASICMIIAGGFFGWSYHIISSFIISVSYYPNHKNYRHSLRGLFI